MKVVLILLPYISVQLLCHYSRSIDLNMNWEYNNYASMKAQLSHHLHSHFPRLLNAALRLLAIAANQHNLRQSGEGQAGRRVTVAEQLACSATHQSHQGESPAGLPDFCRWESCGTMPLFGGFSRRSPISHALSFRAAKGDYSGRDNDSTVPVAHPATSTELALHSELPSAKMTRRALFCGGRCSGRVLVELRVPMGRDLQNSLRLKHCTPVESLALSGDVALDVRSSVALIAPTFLGSKRRKKDPGRRERDSKYVQYPCGDGTSALHSHHRRPTWPNTRARCRLSKHSCGQVQGLSQPGIGDHDGTERRWWSREDANDISGNTRRCPPTRRRRGRKTPTRGRLPRQSNCVIVSAVLGVWHQFAGLQGLRASCDIWLPPSSPWGRALFTPPETTLRRKLITGSKACAERGRGVEEGFPFTISGPTHVLTGGGEDEGWGKRAGNLRRSRKEKAHKVKAVHDKSAADYWLNIPARRVRYSAGLRQKSVKCTVDLEFSLPLNYNSNFAGLGSYLKLLPHPCQHYVRSPLDNENINNPIIKG
ncbi:hypothetical protein PR048_029123 [Dryococelus australis]|uniref:Uncharacterized protein n=1 Tax=Dryococelus australis TaxID=614101 RepID=A0ABQ9GCJ6_9NEOP|nr:hypothetical protein PR048_029123 [Dryococelus australis]